MSTVRVLRVNTFATELDRSSLFHVITYAIHVQQTLTHVTTTSLAHNTKPVNSSILHLRPCINDQSTALSL